MSFLTREQVSWNDLSFLEEIPAVTQLSRPTIRTEKKKKEESSLYANKEILLAPFEFEPVNAEGYYIYSKFFFMPRTNHKAKCWRVLWVV
jgi:hypothetical protein